MDRFTKVVLLLIAAGLFANLFVGSGWVRRAEAQSTMRCEVTNEVRVKGSLTIDTFGKPLAVKVDTFGEPIKIKEIK